MMFVLKTRGRQGQVFAAVLIGLAAFGAAHAEDLSGPALVKALQHGGYVVVMRHASSPQAPPTAAEARPDKPNRERLTAASSPEGFRTPTLEASPCLARGRHPKPSTVADVGADPPSGPIELRSGWTADTSWDKSGW